jgi:hypothetical protein
MSLNIFFSLQIVLTLLIEIAPEVEQMRKPINDKVFSRYGSNCLTDQPRVDIGKHGHKNCNSSMAQINVASKQNLHFYNRENC